MPLSWNEIRSRAIRFSKDWENVSNEDAEAKSFLDGFFDVFGISRRRLATFEKRVKKINNKDGFIDLLWKGQILVEMKSISVPPLGCGNGGLDWNIVRPMIENGLSVEPKSLNRKVV